MYYVILYVYLLVNHIIICKSYEEQDRFVSNEDIQNKSSVSVQDDVYFRLESTSHDVSAAESKEYSDEGIEVKKEIGHFLNDIIQHRHVKGMENAEVSSDSRRRISTHHMERNETNMTQDGFSMDTSESTGINLNSSSILDSGEETLDITTIKRLDVQGEEATGNLLSVGITTERMNQKSHVNLRKLGAIEDTLENGSMDTSQTDLETKQILETKTEMGKVSLRSTLYDTIIESMPTFLREDELRPVSCRNKCGESKGCSCKPICKILKNCCIDFLEVCGDLYNLTLTEETYGWLRTVEKQCISDSTVVSSCRRQVNVMHSVNAQQYPLQWRRFNNSKADNLGNANATGDMKSNMTLIDTLLLILGQEKSLLSEADIAFISTPILDTSTGISYKNISIYNCNSASLSHASIWDIMVAVPKKGYVASSDLRKETDIFKLANFSKTCNHLGYVRSKQTNRNFCVDMEISSCPDTFLNDEVVQACEHVKLSIKVRRRMPNASRVTQDIFKNPFCLYCNTDAFEQIVDITPLNPPSAASCMPYDSVQLILEPLNDAHSSAFWVAPERYEIKTIRKEWLIPDWTILTCRVVWSDKNGKEQKNNAIISSDATDNVTDDKGFMRSVCHVSDCLYSTTREFPDTCEVPLLFPLLLPATKYPLGNDTLSALLKTWNTILQNNIPRAETDEITISQAGYRHLGRSLNKEEFQMSYVLYGALWCGLMPYGSYDALVLDSVVEMLRVFDFPFKTGRHYFCFGLTFGNPKQDREIILARRTYCQSNSLVHIQVNSNSPSVDTALAALQIECFLVLLGILYFKMEFIVRTS